MPKQPMLLTETHHADILIAFYEMFSRVCGPEQGLSVFMTAARAYGFRRGRRMALRALRDGNPLDMASYFAYGELLSTPGAYDGYYAAETGVVHEHQVGCPWAREFARRNLACGVSYCKEIDAAIVRGFQPNLNFACTQNMHTASACDFYYREDGIGRDFMETFNRRLRQGQFEKKDMTYHCADVYQVFCTQTRLVFPKQGDDLVQQVRAQLAKELGADFLPTLDVFANTDFLQL